MLGPLGDYAIIIQGSSEVDPRLIQGLLKVAWDDFTIMNLVWGLLSPTSMNLVWGLLGPTIMNLVWGLLGSRIMNLVWGMLGPTIMNCFGAC